MTTVDHEAYFNNVGVIQKVKREGNISVPLFGLRFKLSSERKSLLSHLDKILRVRMGKIALGKAEVPPDTRPNVENYLRELILMRFSSNPDDSGYASKCLNHLTFEYGQKPGEKITLNQHSNPNWLNLYRVVTSIREDREQKFTDASIKTTFDALAEHKFSKEPELIYILMFIFQKYDGQDASKIGNKLLEVVGKAHQAFKKLAEKGIVRKVMEYYKDDDLDQVMQALLFFMLKTKLRNKSDELLEKIVEEFDSNKMRDALVALGHIVSHSGNLSPEFISFLHTSNEKSFFNGLKLLNPEQDLFLSYDAQCLIGDLINGEFRTNTVALRKSAARIAHIALSSKTEYPLRAMLKSKDFALRLLTQKFDSKKIIEKVMEAEDLENKILYLNILAFQEHSGHNLGEVTKALKVIADGNLDRRHYNLVIDDLCSDLPESLCYLYDVMKYSNSRSNSTDKDQLDMDKIYDNIFRMVELADQKISLVENLSDETRSLRSKDERMKALN